MEEAIVFGTGDYYRKKKEWIDNNYKVIGFIDNSIKMDQEGECAGKAVLNPIDGIKKCNTKIILASVNFVDMYYQLKELGRSESVIFAVNVHPAYDSFEEFIRKNEFTVNADRDSLIISNKDEALRASNKPEWLEIIRHLYEQYLPEVDMIKALPLQPISRRYGREHGTPIDRYYIEKFLNYKRETINGVVGEFGDNTYTLRYGNDVTKSVILHVNGWGENSVRVNLLTGEGIKEGMLDTLICTQTIQFIYDLSKAIKNIYKMLKVNGTALITAHGIAQISPYDYRNWGEYWRFTDKALEDLISNNCKDFDIEVCSYGNVKTCVALLYGLCIEDMSREDLDYVDNQYQMILGVALKKPDSGETA